MLVLNFSNILTTVPLEKMYKTCKNCGYNSHISQWSFPTNAFNNGNLVTVICPKCKKQDSHRIGA